MKTVFSNVHIGIGNKSASFARSAIRLFLVSVPLLSLVVFFEITRPTTPFNDGLFAKRFTTAVWQTALKSKTYSTQHESCRLAEVAHIPGVSAHLASDARPASAETATAAMKASRVFQARNSDHLEVGSETEMLSEEGYRFLFRVIKKEPFSDQAAPSADFALSVAPVSTQRYFNYVVAPWRYLVEIEFQDPSSSIAVQKSL